MNTNWMMDGWMNGWVDRWDRQIIKCQNLSKDKESKETIDVSNKNCRLIKKI
jgi:hypothetical protein